ncbi:MAG: metallophosphoesterase [Nitrospinota bacterium]|nr:metallophosphoesterase [Nitrospinota bacterium]
MKRAILLLFFLAGLIFLAGAPRAAPSIQSSLNSLPLGSGENVKEYSFFIAGHIYGSHNDSPFPAASLLANIGLLNDARPAFMVLAGDIFQRPREDEIRKLRDSFLSKLAFPVFNAPGNHDLYDRQLYSRYFGKTYGAFQYADGLFLFLDSEEGNGRIEGPQLDFLLGQIARFEKSPQLKHLFVFTHRLLWTEGNPPYDEIIPYVNDPYSLPHDASILSKTVLPRLRALPEKYIYFVSGDIGLSSSFSVFYEKEKGSNITYIAAGIGDTENDALVLARISKGKKAEFQVVALAGKTFGPIGNYGVSFWKEYFRERSQKGVLSKSASVVSSKHFWSGFLLAFLTLGGALLWTRRRKATAPPGPSK